MPGQLKRLLGQMVRGLCSARAAFIFGEPLFWAIRLPLEGAKFDLSKTKRILVLRLDEIGDAVLTSAFLRELRQKSRDAWITLVVKPGVFNLVELCPYVNEVLTYDWFSFYLDLRSMACGLLIRRHAGALRLAWRYLWRQRFDVAIVPRCGTDYYHATFLSYFSGARWRIGYCETVDSDKKLLNRGYDLLLTHAIPAQGAKHEAERPLEILRFLGAKVHDDRLEVWCDEEDEGRARQLVNAPEVRNGMILIALGVGASAPCRVWPLENFEAFASWLIDRYCARILVVGGAHERPMGQRLRQHVGEDVISCCGETTLRETAAVLKHCHLFVGNDTGVMHIAAAQGVPVVEISCHPVGASDEHFRSPARFGPWRVPSVVLRPAKARLPCRESCSSAESHCIREISVDDVKEAAVSLLGARVLRARRQVLETSTK
jgi:ADP-heptose:LPS heptosyltransferase